MQFKKNFINCILKVFFSNTFLDIKRSRMYIYAISKLGKFFWLSKMQTDKASMLDEVIEYLKLLQAQVQQLMSMRSMPQMMMPLGMQQHLQMSLLARMGMGVGLGMGMGMGMGMLDMTTMSHSAPQTLASLINPASVSATAPTLVSPPFVLTSMVPTDASAQPKPNSGTNAAVPLPDPYCALLAQVS